MRSQSCVHSSSPLVHHLGLPSLVCERFILYARYPQVSSAGRSDLASHWIRHHKAHTEKKLQSYLETRQLNDGNALCHWILDR